MSQPKNELPPDIEARASPTSPTSTAIPGPDQSGAAPQPQTGPMRGPRDMTRIGDPGGLGFFSFASTLLILSLYNIQTRHITHTNVVVGMAIFCGGLAMILAGMWAFPRGDAYSGTVFVTYGAFWLSYAFILIPGTGILAAYAFDSEFRSALGIYLLVWGLVSFGLLTAGCFEMTSRGSASAFEMIFELAFLFFLSVTFWVWCGGVFVASIGTIKAAGVLGCITAFLAYTCGFIRLIEAGSHERNR